ncbi:hypothetical protein HJA86_28925 [Rhizobium bangladeshense]|nr:hypothetical protein [Rhizobium bangladeshense]
MTGWFINQASRSVVMGQRGKHRLSEGRQHHAAVVTTCDRGNFSGVTVRCYCRGLSKKADEGSVRLTWRGKELCAFLPSNDGDGCRGSGTSDRARFFKQRHPIDNTVANRLICNVVSAVARQQRWDLEGWRSFGRRRSSLPLQPLLPMPLCMVSPTVYLAYDRLMMPCLQPDRNDSDGDVMAPHDVLVLDFPHVGVDQ